MNIANNIKFKIICSKSKLNRNQEKFLAGMMNGNPNPADVLKSLKQEAITTSLCMYAYYSCNSNLERENVCFVTPKRCVSEITDGNVLLDLIKVDLTNYDKLNFEELKKPENYKTFVRVTVAYGHAITDEIIKFRNNPLSMDDEHYAVLQGRMELIKDDYEFAKSELEKIEKEEKEEFTRICKELDGKEEESEVHETETSTSSDDIMN